MKKWEILHANSEGDIISWLLKERGIDLHPKDPYALTTKDVEIHKPQLISAIKRIKEAIKQKESIVVYADYDADGITSGAIMWETLHHKGANVMPYIPHRVDEGYGLSIKGIDAVRELYHPSLVITVDHGITAKEKVAYAKRMGIDVIVTDHHVKPKELPDCTIVHTTKLCGAGVSWFLSKELSGKHPELLALAAIGTIADMIPLVGINRSIVKEGLAIINKTERVGLDALIKEAALTKVNIGTYDVSHILAPRLNAMGRIEHALDALRLLCTHRVDKAKELAQKLGLTNRERQQLTLDTALHAKNLVPKTLKKIIFLAHETYNQGVIGLVAGKLVEEYYRPAVVISKGETFSKASARSIPGFNIVEAIRKSSDILVDVGGHPMAAGFTIETKNLPLLQKRLEDLADSELDEDKLTRKLKIDMEIPLEMVTEDLWDKLQELQPFGFGNPEPVFATKDVVVEDVRLVGNEGKHLKLQIASLPAIAFGLGGMYGKIKQGETVDIAYTIDVDTWNGNKKLQLKIKDIARHQTQ